MHLLRWSDSRFPPKIRQPTVARLELWLDHQRRNTGAGSHRQGIDDNAHH